MTSLSPNTESSSLLIEQRKYARYLIEDQCMLLLHMRQEDIAHVIGITRPTLVKLRKNYGLFTIEQLEKLEEHLKLIKVMILTTEASHE